VPNYAIAVVTGHLGQDPSTKYLPSGDQVTEFTVATNYKRRSGEVVTWWRCSAFGKTAEIAEKYLAKGNPVMVQGTPYNEPWETKEGEKRLTLRLAVDRIVLLRGQEQEREPEPTVRTPPTPGGSDGFDTMADDIPF
jgi:single-strand DNA-binding protein